MPSAHMTHLAHGPPCHPLASTGSAPYTTCSEHSTTSGDASTVTSDTSSDTAAMS